MKLLAEQFQGTKLETKKPWLTVITKVEKSNCSTTAEEILSSNARLDAFENRHVATYNGKSHRRRLRQRRLISNATRLRATARAIVGDYGNDA